MKKHLYSLKYFLQRIFRVAFRLKKLDNVIWEDLKTLHKQNEWRYGCYETERFIETGFEIEENHVVPFYYFVSLEYFQCRVKIVESYSIDETTNIFILASHFNNVLRRGKIIINVEAAFVEYQEKLDSLLPFIYSGELYAEIIRHHRTAKDAYQAFQRLIKDQEEPAIIIADLLRNNQDKQDS